MAVLLAALIRPQAQEVAWTYTPLAGHVDVSPVTSDLDGDGHADLVVGTTGGQMVALNARGRELWHHTTRDAVCIPPTIADVTGDGSPAVLAVNRQGEVVCLEGRTGDVIWSTMLPSPPQWGASCLAVGDLRGDGAVQVMIGTRDGGIVCLAGESGEREWETRGDWATVFSPALADLDGDHRLEVLVGTEKVSLLCLDADGREKWRRSEGTGGSPFVWLAGPTNSARIFCGMGRRLHALDAAGRTLWSHPMNRELDSAIAIADADGDGQPEVYAVDLAGHAVSLTLDGRLRWEAEVEERCRRSPAIVDIDGDGRAEILIAGYSRALHAFEPGGKLKMRVPLPGPSNGTPTPIALDDPLAVVVPVAGAPLQALRWPQSHREARVLWGGCRYDAAHTGTVAPTARRAVVRMTLNLVPLPGGRARADVTIVNPERHALRFQSEVLIDGKTRPPGQTEFSAAEFHRTIRLALPASSGPSRLRLTCRVSDGTETVARCSRTLYVREFVTEVARVDEALRAAQSRLPKLLDARGVEERSALVATKLTGVRSRLADTSPLTERERLVVRRALTGLTSEAETLDRLTALGVEAAVRGSPIRVGAVNPWAPFGGITELVEGRATSTNLTVFAFGDETESAVLNVFNLSSQARTFRVELEPLVPSRPGAGASNTVSAALAVGLFEVIEVPTERCDLQADALAPLGMARVLQVPPWGARQLWLNIDARGLAAGEWRSRVRLRSLEVVPVEAGATLAVTVAAARLPERQRLHQCGWGYVESSLLKDHPAEALADQVTHGTDVFVGLHFPQARFDAEGNLVGEIDYREHDAYVRQHAPHGVILFCGYQGALQGPAPEGSPAHRRAMVTWLRAWVKHLAAMGVGYDGFALYPVDEPGLSQGLVTAYLRHAKVAREADPRIRMYTDPVGGITEEELRDMLPYVDIWCPNRAGLVLDANNRAKLEIIKYSGKEVWMYECADNAKHQPPLGYYRGQAWLAWSHRLTGIGFWSYCTSADDPWFVPQQRYDYLLVYPGQGVVSSKRWEAVRDGIEDYALLAALREKLEAAGGAVLADTRTAAQRLLGEEASRIGGFCSLEDDRRPMTRAERCRVEDERWQQLQDIRRELARLLTSF